ncbi:MAG: hypothetical protein DHS20C05_17440 [Hyphococcus sp.]|nr:MAG: hypothetical protein DHS20C05_17440 [Marinicaulis sp.]
MAHATDSRDHRITIPLPLSASTLLVIGTVLACVGVFLSVPMPFIIDGGIYIDMTRAMAENGALHIAADGGVDGAPPLTKFLTDPKDGLVYPQYPSGYAFLAAPFYMAFGVHGLILMNTLSAVMCAWLTYQVAKTLYTDETAKYAVIIFAAATFVPNYAFSIWPHMLSLAVSLCAIYCTVLAREEKNQNREIALMLGAGLLIGAAINIRVDTILIFPILFFWLRLFTQPTNRLAPLLLLLGMAPGLAVATYLNYIKFGVLSPLSYGPSSAGDTNGRYIPLIIGGVGLLALLWLVNVSALARTVFDRLGARKMMVVCGGGLVIALLIGGGFIWKILYGAYVLIINLQAHDAYYQAGVEKNEFGQLLFWGYPKKALIQSLPFLPLVILPMVAFFKGKEVTATALCLLAIAAPIVFYSMHQWHGGGSYNMRYFIPALPFITMLTAVALRTLFDKASAPSRQTILLILFGAALLFFLMQSISNGSERLYAPAALYPQWIIASACLISILFFLWKNDSRTGSLASLIGVFAIGYSAILGFSDEASGQKARGAQLAMSEEIADVIPDRALVLTQLPILLMHAEEQGASIMVVQEENLANAAQALNAFEAAGRCVIVHNSLVARLLQTQLPPQTFAPKPVWAGAGGGEADPRLAFYLLKSQLDSCTF